MSPNLQWNIDMEDWEKVLRIECQGITPTEISKDITQPSTFMHRNWNETEKTSNKLITRQVFYFLIIFFHSNLLHPSVDGYKSDVITYCKRFNSQCFVHWLFLNLYAKIFPLYFPQNLGELPKEQQSTANCRCRIGYCFGCIYTGYSHIMRQYQCQWNQ